MTTCKSCFSKFIPYFAVCLCMCLHTCLCTYGADSRNKEEMKEEGKWYRVKGEMKSRKLQPGVNGKIYPFSWLWCREKLEILWGRGSFFCSSLTIYFGCSIHFPLTSVLFHLEIRRKASAIDTTFRATDLIERFFFFFFLCLRFLNSKTEAVT